MTLWGYQQPATLCRYTDIFVGQPQVEEDYITSSITPQQCRLRDMTYAAPITVDVEYTRGKEIVVRKGKDGVGAVYIGRIPLMLRCDRSAHQLPAAFCASCAVHTLCRNSACVVVSNVCMLWLLDAGEKTVMIGKGGWYQTESAYCPLHVRTSLYPEDS